MLFSIIIPVYNVEPYLSECLDSVLVQTFSEFEVICVNDGSTDNSGTILTAYAKKDNRVTIVTQENSGLSAARNTGLKAAKGDYVFFLDSDDWMGDNTLEVLSKHIHGQDIVAFNGKRVFECGDNEVTDKGIHEEQMTGWHYFDKYVLQDSRFAFVCVVLRLYRRDFLLNNHLFFEVGLYHEDNLFTPLVCYYAENATSVTDVLYYYRIRSGSIMTSNKVKRSRDVITVANRLAAFFEDKQVERASLNRYIAGLYFRSFMPENRMPEYEKELMTGIDWKRCQQVCTYPRHKRMYKLLTISPKFFRAYVRAEQFVKRMVR